VGAKNADERAALRRDLLLRAERSLAIWTQ